MKVLLFLFSAFSLSVANEIIDNFDIRNVKFDLDETLVENFLSKYEEGDDAAIVAIVNEYADQIFRNIESFAVENHLDPLNLTDIEEDFLTASITLTNGELHGFSTIDRYDNVTVSYSTSTKLLDVYLPIIFSNLNFTYNYHVIILLIGPKGSIVGKISDFKMDIKLQFNFNTYHAEVVDVNTSNKGHVSLTFHGNAIVDVVVNVLSEFATTVLQPLIGSRIEGIVSDVVQLIVDTVNNAIDSILYPATSTAASLV